MSTMRRTIALAVLGVAALAGQVSAQESGLWIAGTGSFVWDRNTEGDSRQSWHGLVGGAEGGLNLGLFGLRAGYVQGKLSASSAGAAGRQQVEGFAFVTLQPARFFSIAAGPVSRAHVTDGSVERWLFWQLRAHVEVPIGEMGLRGFAEGWDALARSVNAGQHFDNGRGGRVGLMAPLARGALGLRLAYSIDEARLGAGARRETVEGIAVTVGYHMR